MITTRSGRVVKKPVLYEPPVEKMTDDYDTDEYNTDDESDLSGDEEESGSESGESRGSIDEFIDDEEQNEDGEEFM